MKSALLIISILIPMLLECTSGPDYAAIIRRIPDSKKKVILFQNFDNNSAGPKRDEFDGFRGGFPKMVLTDFVNFGAFRIVSAEDRKAALKELAVQRSGLIKDTGLDIGKMIGAEWLLAGSFTEFRGTMSINARLVNIETARAFVASSITGKTETKLPFLL